MNRNKSAEMFGIIGYPLSYSLSPEIHNHFFWKFGLNCTYHIFPTRKEELKHVVAAIRVLGVKGINVTIPFKERIILYLDELDTLAEKVGAVNTVTNHKGKLTGYNTDVFGIHQTVKHRLKLNLKGKTVILLGAGGAARAVFSEFLTQRVKTIFVFNRTRAKAQRLINSFSLSANGPKVEVSSLKDLERFSPEQEITLLVNATTLSFASLNIRLRNRLSNLRVFDLNYNLDTSCEIPYADRYTDGLYMLASQAALSFRIWTKIKLEPEEVYRYLCKLTGRRQ